MRKRWFPALYWDFIEQVGRVCMILMTPWLVSSRHFDLYFTLDLVSLGAWVVLWSWLRPYITPVELVFR